MVRHLRFSPIRRTSAPRIRSPGGSGKNAAILHYAAPPVIGGVEATICHHAVGLAERGYRVKVIAGRGEVFAPGVAFQRIPEVDSTHPDVLAIQRELGEGRVGSGFRSLRGRILVALDEALAESDVCIVHNAFTLHKNLALTAALHQLAGDDVLARPLKPASTSEGSVRFIAWCHDLAWTNPLYLPQLRDRYPWNLLKTPLEGMRYVVVSRLRHRELAGLMGIAEEEIRVIPPGVDPAEFWDLTETTRRRIEGLGFLEAAPLMLLPARITKRKNIELAIEVLAALRGMGWDARLIVTGPPGPHNVRNVTYLENLKKLRRRLGVEGEVVFLYESCGEVGDEVVADLFLLADLLFFPSTQEGFGVPVLEAGLARMPIFCADIPPFRESGEGAAHFYSLDESPPRIARRIAAFLAEDGAYRMRRRVLRRYTWPAILDGEIVPLLEEFLGECERC